MEPQCSLASKHQPVKLFLELTKHDRMNESSRSNDEVNWSSGDEIETETHLGCKCNAKNMSENYITFLACFFVTGNVTPRRCISRCITAQFLLVA